MSFKNKIAVLSLISSIPVFAQEVPIEINIKIKGDLVINPVSSHFFGHNYWQWCDKWENMTSGTESKISELNVKLLRFGGINVDVEYPNTLTNSVITEFNSYCKAIGAEPMFQVPIARFNNSSDKISSALRLVKYYKSINKLTYVSIGNEPDIYSVNLAANPDYKVSYLSKYKLSDYCEDFNAVSSALKAAHPDLKIIGLELSHNREGWIPGFVADCKDNLDMISVHYYPFNAAQCTYDNARGQFHEINDFYSHTRKLIDQNAGGKDIPLIIGETNITYDGDPVKSNKDASPGTFAAALWFADFLGVSSAQRNLFSVMPWSIREGWTLGFLSPQKKPVFYVYKMFSDYYKNNLIHIENINNSLRVYGYKDDQDNSSFFIVNWDTTSSYKTKLSFSGILNNSNYECIVPPFSLSCITLSSDMKEKSFYTYTKKLQSNGPISESDRKFKDQFIKKKSGFLKIKSI
ncbi:MAG: hypothetical protein GX640_02080 [Fibrobacter sp.]|nr:hypothetical protein [Fibrobacter sp.]